MNPRRKRSPEEVWDALEKMALEDEVERVLALSDEEVDRELLEAGVDPDKVRARGAALAEEIRRKQS